MMGVVGIETLRNMYSVIEGILMLTLFKAFPVRRH